ncbi:CBS domain-containing protein [Paenibacillus phyllosphaerae]|uniref:CBS domain-containing protein n=1 Tax=Paenibacillus phyllosphaerae TaxID=274593 RepID=A0A7W5B5Q6_9BACL|nr:CBS domain-containing protein [Paenibacillus phyllosphaerae]
MRLVGLHAPITGDQIAELLGTSRATIRSDLSLLVMLNLLRAKPKVGYFPGEGGETAPREQRWGQTNVQQVQGIPVVITGGLSVHEAVVTLILENVETLSVIDDHKRFLGIVTAKDLLKLTLGNPQAGTMPVGMAMSRLPAAVALTPEDRVETAVGVMLTHGLDGVPVLSPEREVIGWVSKTTVLRRIMEHEG